MKKKKILEAFMFRHACKEFDSEKKISKEDFAFILETARLSPSSFGFEPWHFLIIQKKELRETFVEVAWGGKKQFPTASHLLFALVKKGYFMRHNSEYIQNFMQEIQQLPQDIIEKKTDLFKTFQESDFDLLESERAMTDWATRQTYIPLANMMTVAAMIGIDSCPMEGFDRKKMDSLLATELNIETDKFSMAYALAFGYRKEEPKAKTRQNIEAITSWFEED